MENEFPPNPNNPKRPQRPSERPERKEPAQDCKDLRKVTRGKVTMRRKPLHRKFLDAFKPEDNAGFVEHTVITVLVPGIKDAFADAVHGTIDNMLGTSSVTRRRGTGRGGYTSYNRMSTGSRRRDDDDDRRDRRRPGSNEMAEAILESRVEAEEVLETLIELSSKYGAASKRDLLAILGEPHTPVDDDWGWVDLRGARIHRLSRNAYLLDLPRPEPLD